MPKVLVLYYSTYGHVEAPANAIAAGARSVAGVEVSLKRVPETLPPDVAKQAGAKLDQAAPVASPTELADITEVKGGSPWGAATIDGADGSRQPSAKELAQARFQGKHVATIAARLHA